MQTVIMLFFYGFLSGLAVLFTGLSLKKKRVLSHTAELLSAAGVTLTSGCFVLILCCGYVLTAYL